jgi:hypothetical protein
VVDGEYKDVSANGKYYLTKVGEDALTGYPKYAICTEDQFAEGYPYEQYLRSVVHDITMPGNKRILQVPNPKDPARKLPILWEENDTVLVTMRYRTATTGKRELASIDYTIQQEDENGALKYKRVTFRADHKADAAGYYNVYVIKEFDENAMARFRCKWSTKRDAAKKQDTMAFSELTLVDLYRYNKLEDVVAGRTTEDVKLPVEKGSIKLPNGNLLSIKGKFLVTIVDAKATDPKKAVKSYVIQDKEGNQLFSWALSRIPVGYDVEKDVIYVGYCDALVGYRGKD